jgi:hypothetical protein
MGARKRDVGKLAALAMAYGASMGAPPGEMRVVDQRLTSFLERYLIERIGKCKGDDPLQEAWLIIQDGRKAYQMIQEVGAKGS